MTPEESPQLYSYLGKLYLYTDLLRAVENNIDSYLSSLEGDDNRLRTRDAIYNLLSGYGDNSISYLNGRFVDSRGRYSNNTYYDSEGKVLNTDKDDYYGLAAAFLRKLLGRSKEYTSETSRTKKITPSLSLLQRLFNTDTNPNYYYFADNDLYNEETGIRGISNRAALILPLIQEDINNTTDENQKRYLQAAYQSISDNSIDSGDYYALSRAYTDIPWEKIFYTGKVQPSDTQQSGQGLLTTSQSPQLDVNEFLQWYLENYPTYTGDSSWHSLQDGIDYGDSAENFNKLLLSRDSQDLYTLLNNILNGTSNNTSSFSNKFRTSSILNTLKSRGELIGIDANRPGLYYIPQLKDNENKGAVYIWDSVSNTIRKASRDSIPYFLKSMFDEWLNKDKNWYDQLFTVSQHKSGGVLRAQEGTDLWYSGLSAIGDYDPNKYNYSYDTSRLVNADLSTTDWDPWISNIAGLGVGKYKPTAGNTRSYTLGIENTQYYRDFGKALLNSDGTFTDVGSAWAKAVDALLPKGSAATFYDENGNLRTSWTPTTNDVYGRKPQTFNNLADYVNYVRNDLILGSRHNVFLNLGNRYFYRDQDGVEHWVDPKQVANYNVSANPVRSSWNNDNTVYWHDYELTGLKNNENKPSTELQPVELNNTYVTPELTTVKDSSPSFTSSNWLQDLYSDVLGVGRMALSLRTNNKVARTLRDATKPILKNTYELYSPVTGAFSEMLFRNRLAADLRRLAARPFTSDASLLLAGNLDANRRARDLEYQGFLADDKEIRRTKEAALARQEDNVKRRTEVANENRKAINESNWQKALIEAQRLKSNWGSVDNYLLGLELRIRTRFAEDKALKQGVSLQYASNLYRNAIQQLNRQYKEQNPDATTSTMLADLNYVDKVNALRDRYQYDMYNIMSGRYYANPYSGTVLSYSLILSSKRGGILRPSIMNLVNKIIKDENRT